jgi:urea transport system permease protein
MKTLSSLDRQSIVVLSLLAAAAVLVPAMNGLAAPDSALHLPDHLVPLLGKYICFALLALSVDLIWGFCGILSLGHGAFFALGGYAMGMYLMRQIGPRGVYADPILPDFMVFLNWKELPWFWHGFDWFPFSALMVLLVPGALAFTFGWFAFRSRVTGVYLSIITQAMTFALMLAFFRNDMGFGGNNGLTDFKDILGFPLQSSSTRIVLFVLSVAALATGYVLCRWVVTPSSARCSSRCGTRRVARVSSAIGSSTTSSRSSPCQPCSPASRVRSMCRRWGLSTRASLLRRTRSRW